ncbi:hypothetical protein SNE40_018350 [Patella caerulea]|uniref:Uncharacterized protein n=1 Tax=Patella caerulea TaxID=87958 RepID=A0AAN8PKZ3_PATCE
MMNLAIILLKTKQVLIKKKVYRDHSIHSSQHYAFSCNTYENDTNRKGGLYKSIHRRIQWGCLNKGLTSYSTADRSRREVGDLISDTIKEQWNAPKFASIHWDSKLQAKLDDRYEKDERLIRAIGTSKEVKILGIPGYQPGTD